jgi:Flagellar FliJ protein
MNRQRLKAVRRVREIQERGARGEVAREGLRHRNAVAAEQHTWEQLDAFAVAGHGGGDAAPRLTALHAIREAGVRASETQHAATEQAHARVLAARDVWTTAARRVEALTRLDDRLGEAEQLEAERTRNNEIDDLVLARRNLAAASSQATSGQATSRQATSRMGGTR